MFLKPSPNILKNNDLLPMRYNLSSYIFPWHNKRLNFHLLSITLIMNSSAFQWLHTLVISFFLTSFCLKSFLSSATQISYADDHCNSTVHESNLNKFEPSMSSFAVLHTGHYTGGNEIQSHNPSETSHSLTLRTLNVYRTDKNGEFAIEGSLLLRSRNSYYCEGDVT